MNYPAYLHQTLLAMHFVGLAFGLGGAAVADVSFMRALKMGDRITPETVAWMRMVSSVVWTGLGLLTISGLILVLLEPSRFLGSPGFLAKMIIVTILFINGLFLNFYTTARLTTFNFSVKYQRRDTAWKARKLSLIFGVISTVSWYSALAIAVLKDSFKLSLIMYLALYLSATVLAIVVALFVEQKLFFKKHQINNAALKQPTGANPADTVAPSSASPTTATTGATNSHSAPASVQPTATIAQPSSHSVVPRLQSTPPESSTVHPSNIEPPPKTSQT